MRKRSRSGKNHREPREPREPREALEWLDVAIQNRLLTEGTDAFRLADSSRLWVERFGSAGMISHQSTLPDGLIEETRKRLGSGPLFVRRLVHGPGSANRPERVGGIGSETIFSAHEAGLTFEVDFSSGYSCGLFLDQRANRARLKALAPRRVLNCFAYTCSFSVVAAAAGAVTTSVDLARAALNRGRRNFDRNGLPTQGHRFLEDDARDALPRLARRGEKFDAIILDPPTFARGRGGRVFQVEDHIENLLRMALECATEETNILISTNCPRLDTPHLLRRIHATANKPLRATPQPPPEDFPAGRAASTVWISHCDNSTHSQYPPRKQPSPGHPRAPLPIDAQTNPLPV